MKKQFISGFLLTLLLSSSAGATEYIYRDLMANTLPAHCDVESKAKQAASKPYTVDRFSKRFCQTQGYGWHLDAIKTAGNTSCSPCGTNGDKQQCFQEDVVVTCKRIKPGTVGMLPGKG
ncbi:MAG: hypothetical protein M0R33_22770 [Methylomonas sp.]|jgi:hypothetical protein|uniref:hypothetical protein n=1 Tax=Methylomonas sp. TaxID=418 RepID=UPI0025CD4B2F|nr:hypothetical protein [Methylomonas sp.]MCK9609268.1 hypothetical protein [Methylomonas sp.]